MSPPAVPPTAESPVAAEAAHRAAQPAAAPVRAPVGATGREVGIVAALLLAIGLAVYAPHIADGGFTVDDWSHVAGTEFPRQGLLADLWQVTSNRPVLVVYIPALHLVLGQSPELHNAWSIVLAAGMALALYTLLRRLAFGRVTAGGIALLAMLLPISDSTRLWATASHINLGIALGLAGILLALKGARRSATEPSRRAWPLHAGALLLYATSILTYEIAGVVLLLAGALYLREAPPRLVLPRWAADVAVIGACLVWSTSRANRERPSLDAMLDHARMLADQALTAFARSAMPYGGVGRTTLAAATIAVLVVAVGIWRALPPGDDARRVLARWLGIAAAAVVFTAAAWVTYIPADPYYSFDAPGIGNRTNALAGLGVVTFLVAVAVLGITVLLRGLPRWQRSVSIGTALFILVLGVGYVRETRVHADQSIRANAGAQKVLAAMKRSTPRPAPGTTFYTFGHPGSEVPGHVIFAFTWDLVGATKVLYGDGSLAGYPILAGSSMTCAAKRTMPVGPQWVPPDAQGADYGSAVFVDVASGTAERIDSRAECERVLPRFVPGPEVRLPG